MTLLLSRLSIHKVVRYTLHEAAIYTKWAMPTSYERDVLSPSTRIRDCVKENFVPATNESELFGVI